MVGVSASVDTIKSRSSLLAPAHPGGPGKRAVKRLWCGGTMVTYEFTPLVKFTYIIHADLLRQFLHCAFSTVEITQ